MNHINSIGPIPLTVIGSLLMAVLLLVIRIMIMQRVQSKRQRENRQETERLKSMVAAYRAMAGSFTPGTAEQGMQVEEALADIVLFGTLEQVQCAAHCALKMKTGGEVDLQPLVQSLRLDIRKQLGLDPIPDTLDLPASGPSRTPPARGGEGRGAGAGGAGGRGGGGGAGGGGGDGALIAGLGVGHGIGHTLSS